MDFPSRPPVENCMGKNPEISVVIPLYNKEEYITECLESVICQSKKGFEVIVIDDGSTDNSLIRVRNFADSRIRILTQKNSGPGIARNLGIENATAKYIAFLDADDIWSPNHLDEIMAIWSVYPGAGAVSTTIQVIKEQPPRLMKAKRSRVFRKVDYFKEAAVKTSIVHTSAASVRKEVIKKIGGFKNRRNGEDIEMWARIALHYDIVVSKNVTVGYRLVSSGLSETARVANNSANYKLPKKIDQSSPVVATLVDFMKRDNRGLESHVEPELKVRIKGYLYARFRRRLHSQILNGNLNAACHILEMSNELGIGEFAIVKNLLHYKRLKILKIYIRVERFVRGKWKYLESKL